VVGLSVGEAFLLRLKMMRNSAISMPSYILLNPLSGSIYGCSCHVDNRGTPIILKSTEWIPETLHPRMTF
jgi:hypothetical protein